MLAPLICVLVAVRNALVEAAAASGIRLPLKAKLPRPSHVQMLQFLGPFAKNQQALLEHAPVLQCAAAALAALDPTASAARDAAAAAEKVLLLLPEAERMAAIANLVSEAQDSADRGRTAGQLSTKELFERILLARVAPAEPIDEERRGGGGADDVGGEGGAGDVGGEGGGDADGSTAELRRRLADLAAAEAAAVSGGDLEGGMPAAKAGVDARFAAIEAAVARSRLAEGGIASGWAAASPGEQLEPAVRRLVRAIFDGGRPALPGLEYTAGPAGDRGLLRKGIGMLGGLVGGGLAATRPDDSELLVFFCVGGWTWAEVRAIREVAAVHRRSMDSILIGGTAVCADGALITDWLFADGAPL